MHGTQPTSRYAAQFARNAQYYTTPFFFFNEAATTEIYTLSLHDALPIFSGTESCRRGTLSEALGAVRSRQGERQGDRKSTRLNSSHMSISYAVFCLKKKRHTLRAVLDRCFAEPVRRCRHHQHTVHVLLLP